ncbi:MAG: alpha/beta fold hydrolase [Polyangiales bacterium]
MIVLVHGYDGSGPGHWQHWLNDELRARGAHVVFPDLPSPLEPERDVWVEALARVVADAEPGSVTLVAHSLGCWAVDHYVARHGTSKLRAVLLVAPPSAYSLFEPIQSFLPPPRSRDAWAPIRERTLLVGSDDDEYASDDEFVEVAEAIDVPVEILPGLGHINLASGFGPFPKALEWLERVGAL